MREPYVPIFDSIRTSSMWAQDAETRIFWLTLLLVADPEGDVSGALPGLAIAANLSLEAACRAMKILESPDPHSRTREHEGRRVLPVERGWRIVNFAAHRALARREAELARKRRWWHANRGAHVPIPQSFLDAPLEVPLDASLANLDALAQPRESLDASTPKSKSKSKPTPRGKVKEGSAEGDAPPAAPPPAASAAPPPPQSTDPREGGEGSPEPTEAKGGATKRSKGPSRGPTAIPADLAPEPDDVELARVHRKDVRLELDRMRDWALGKNIRRANWRATFRNWLRSDGPGRSGPAPRQQSGVDEFTRSRLEKIRRLEEEEAKQ